MSLPKGTTTCVQVFASSIEEKVVSKTIDGGVFRSIPMFQSALLDCLGDIIRSLDSIAGHVNLQLDGVVVRVD